MGRRLTFLSQLTNNPRELLDAINQVDASQDTFHWDALLSVSKELSVGEEEGSSQRSHRVVLISDGSFSDHALPETIEFLKVGTAQGNVGLVAADMAYLPSGENQLAFYYQIASSFESPQQIDLTVARLDDSGTEQLKKVIPLTVLPGVQPPEVFTLDDAQPGHWIAKLEVEDALASDNTAQLAAIRPPPIRIAVDASDPFFFENSVIAFNPPYGVRMKDDTDLGVFYKNLGDFLKQRCKGSDAYILFGNREMIKKIGLKPSWKKPLRNGGLDGRLVKYEMF